MSKTGAAVAALFLGLALFQGARGLFFSDPATVPAPPATETPSPTLEPTPTESAKLKPFPKFSGPVPEPKSYPSTDELVASLEARGIQCTNLQFLDQPDPTLTEFSLCDSGTASRRFNIYFYESEENRQLWLGYMKEQKLPLPLVWGPNWIVVSAGEPSTAKARIKSIQGAIGGTVEDFAPKKK
jgi:hypothetical protein